MGLPYYFTAAQPLLGTRDSDNFQRVITAGWEKHLIQMDKGQKQQWAETRGENLGKAQGRPGTLSKGPRFDSGPKNFRMP